MLFTAKQEQIQKSKAYENFMNGISSKDTQRTYRITLIKYMEFAKVKNPDDLLKMAYRPMELETKKYVEEKLRGFIIWLRGQAVTARSIKVYCFGIVAFYVLNDVIDDARIINTKKLWRFLPENHRPIKDRAYTQEEIAKMLEAADERTKVIILLMASGGFRRGALPELKIGDLQSIEDFYQITVYAGYDEEYFSFCTPECRKAIDSYIELRKRFGEAITKSSPLLRDSFDLTISDSAKDNVQPITKFAIESILWRHIHKNGIRPNSAKHLPANKHKYPRTETYIAHSLRKFFNTQLIKARIRPQTKEMLMGHTIKGIQLDNSYYKPTLDEMIEEYKTAIPILTINEENRLKLKLKEEKEDHQKQLEKITAEIDSIKEAMARVLAKGEVKPL